MRVRAERWGMAAALVFLAVIAAWIVYAAWSGAFGPMR